MGIILFSSLQATFCGTFIVE